ncbi:hypothetical protein BGZ94_007875 [Podila epigama]|nr:hypothetical protein BGZ94_007875 [Podila epigama]
MNMLVGYESSSESETEATSLTQPGSRAGMNPVDPNHDDDDVEAKIANSLKELQEFAASVAPEEEEHSPASKADNAKDVDESEMLMSFMKEIEAIPYIPDGEYISDPPPPPPSPSPPPPPPPPVSEDTELDPPPPPPPPPAGDQRLLTKEIVQSIYSRLQSLGLLPVPSVNQKDLKRRLVEFNIRIKDWEKGGLDSEYFLGNEMAHMPSAGQDGFESLLAQGMEETLQSFGGIVGSMVKYMCELEQSVSPSGWKAIWDADDDAYGFRHVHSGTISPVYPSQELLQRLATQEHSLSTSTTLARPNQRNISIHTTTSISRSPSLSPSSTVRPVHLSTHNNPQVDFITSTPISSKASTSRTVVPVKRKSQKSEEHTGDMDAGIDQHVHQSRRSIFTQKTTPAGSSSSSGGTKVMPKKLATLLQKWQEKDISESDEEDDDAGKESSYPARDSRPPPTMTGANSQSLGSDWRERRLNQR